MRLATRRTLPQGITALLALTSPFAPPGNAASFQKDVVVRVLDDDKVKLEALGTVQLAGIRTPTRGVPDCYARVPFVRARALRPRAAVGVKLRRGRARRSNWRTASVNAALVREGYAKRRLRKNDDDALASALLRRGSGGLRLGLGIWAASRGRQRVARPTFVATFDDVDFKPAPAKDFGDAPTVVRSCADFSALRGRFAIFERGTPACGGASTATATACPARTCRTRRTGSAPLQEAAVVVNF
ncbi:hypothetical protein SO694_00018450 [Aureococcus anophagefferens]|uniref:TNase-like domain-containing protein n=1 Tax=Aureococcus anophagefferens TaxID=44056 RepID=A0ABR1G0W9_AURAN